MEKREARSTITELKAAGDFSNQHGTTYVYDITFENGDNGQVNKQIDNLEDLPFAETDDVPYIIIPSDKSESYAAKVVVLVNNNGVEFDQQARIKARGKYNLTIDDMNQPQQTPPPTAQDEGHGNAKPAQAPPPARKIQLSATDHSIMAQVAIKSAVDAAAISPGDSGKNVDEFGIVVADLADLFYTRMQKMIGNE